MAWIHPEVLGRRHSYMYIPSGRCGHTTNAYKSFLILFGGYDGHKWLNDLYQLDTHSLVWKSLSVRGKIPKERQYHTSSIIENKMYIFGGYSGCQWLNDMVSFDLSLHRWSFPILSGISPTPREGHSMASNGVFLYVYGGWDSTALSDFYKISTRTFESERIQMQCPALCGHTMTLVHSKLLIFGGFDGTGWSSDLAIIDLDKPAWEHLQAIGNPGKRGYHSAIKVKKHVIYYGGYNGECIMGDLLVLDMEKMVWTVPDTGFGSFPMPRNAHTMTKIGSEAYMFGGYTGLRDSNELHILETSAFSTLHKDLLKAYKDDRWKDITLVSNTAKCMVHSIILRKRCPDMFIDGESTYLVGNCCEEALNIFCEYLYTDTCRPLLDFNIRDDVLELASKYNLPRLISMCFYSVYSIECCLPLSSLAEDLTNAIEDPDLLLFIDKKVFYLHKAVLAVRCPFFERMLSNKFKESLESTVKLDEICPSAFSYIVQWIYSDRFSPLFDNQDISMNLAIRILKATNFLGMNCLIRLTEIYIGKRINSHNVMDLLEISHCIGALKLRSSCLNFILKENKTGKLLNQIKHLSPSTVEFLSKYLPNRINRQRLIIREAENKIFPMIVRSKTEKQLDNFDLVITSPKFQKKTLKSIKNLKTAR